MFLYFYMIQFVIFIYWQIHLLANWCKCIEKLRHLHQSSVICGSKAFEQTKFSFYILSHLYIF